MALAVALILFAAMEMASACPPSSEIGGLDADGAPVGGLASPAAQVQFKRATLPEQ